MRKRRYTRNVALLLDQLKLMGNVDNLISSIQKMIMNWFD